MAGLLPAEHLYTVIVLSHTCDRTTHNSLLTATMKLKHQPDRPNIGSPVLVAAGCSVYRFDGMHKAVDHKRRGSCACLAGST